MAINKKLIHFDMTKQLFMSNANGLNNLTKPTNGIVGNIPYYSVVFLKDGYIWTHGHFINGTGIADSVSGNATISWSKITDKPSTFTPSAHTQAYTTLTGSGTTANQAIVSSGTANGWTLKTLGSRAFDNTNYLPLIGGTMSGTAVITFADSGNWGKSNEGVTFPLVRGGFYWSGQSDWISLKSIETTSDNLDLVLQFGDDNSNGLSVRNKDNTQVARINASGIISAASFVKTGGLSSQFLKADGSIDSTAYLPLSGGTMTGIETISATSAISFANRTSSGTRASHYTSGNYIHGGEDHADQDGANVQIGTWYGFGIYPTISGQTRTQGKNSFWHNARTGNTYTWGEFYSYDGSTNRKVLHEGNSSVSKNGETLSVKINGTTQSLTNTWRGIQNNLTSSSTTDSLSAYQGHLLANGSARDNTKLPLAGGTMVGTISASSDAYGGGGFHNGYANIILRGNTTTGTSGIVFSSSKGDTSINRPSDCAFIQYHPYGISTATAVGTNPTIETSGEAGRFVIGIHNDSGDQLWLQTSAVNDLKHVVGANVYTIYDSGNLPAYPTKASWNYDDRYVSSLTTNGNHLRWVKNGSNNDITIPYATFSGSISQATISSLSNFTHSTNLIYTSAQGDNNIADKPSGVDAFGVFSYKTAAGWYGQLLTSSDNHTGLYWRTAINLSGGWKKILDSSNYTDYTVTKTGSGASGTWNINITGSAGKATNDSDGNAINSTYLKKSGGTMSGGINMGGNSITNLGISGGIYWNPYVESARDGSDAASIRIVTGGVAGGTTLVISQMNDANDTIQFSTNASASLYHNSNVILTSGNSSISESGSTATIKINGTSKTVSLSSHTHSYLPLTGGSLSGYLTVSGGSSHAPLIVKGGLGGYRHNIQLIPANNWSGILFGANDVTGEVSNTTTKSYWVGNNDGKFSIAKNGSGNASVSLYCDGTDWYVNTKRIIHSGNIGSQSVNYATSAGNANRLKVYTETSNNTNVYRVIGQQTLNGSWVNKGLVLAVASRHSGVGIYTIHYGAEISNGYYADHNQSYTDQYWTFANAYCRIRYFGDTFDTNDTKIICHVKPASGDNPKSAVFTFFLHSHDGSSPRISILQDWGDPFKLIENGATMSTIDTSVYGELKETTIMNESNSCTGNSATATKATQDSDGNQINTTYLKRSGGTMTGLLTTTSGSHFGLKVGDTYITAIGGELIFQNNNCIRFGTDAWSYDKWAGLKFDADNKIIYLGCADGTIFNKSPSGVTGTIRTPNISDIYIGNGTHKVWHAGNDGSGSGLDADLLDGLHLNRVFGTYTREQIGTSPNFDNPSIQNGLFELRVTSETTGETGTKPFNGFAPFLTFKVEHVMMLLCGNNGNGWFIRGTQSANVTMANTAWQKLARTTDNVASATKLQTTRTLWGQSFDGSGNVDGKITLTYNADEQLKISASYTRGANAYAHAIDIINPALSSGEAYLYEIGRASSNSNSAYFGYVYGGDSGTSYATIGLHSHDRILNVTASDRVGIGTTTPSYKLDVNGTLHASGATTLSSTLYVGNNATIAGTLGVYGTTTLKSATTITANAYISGETFFSAVDAFRLNYGSYGVIHRNDGGSYWILLTNKNNQNGGFNSLRPFHIDFSTGTVYMDNNAIIDNLAFTQCNISMGGRVNATWGYDLNTSDYYGLYFKSKNSSSTGILFNDDGNVGINTLNPQYKLDVNGTLHVSDTITATSLAADYKDTWNDGTHAHPWYGYDLRYANTGVYSTTISDYFGMTLKTKSGNISITNGGNVGIGTFAPLRKLHVIGEAIFGESGYVATQGTGSGYSGTWVGQGFMELSAPNPYIDFHANKSTADFTSRLIQWSDKVRLLYVSSDGAYNGYILTCEGNHHNPVILGIFDLKRSGPGSTIWTLDNICGPCVFTLANNWGSNTTFDSHTYWTIPSNLLRVEINGILGDNYATKTTVKAAACIGTVMTRWMNNQPVVSNRSHEDIAGCSVECLCTDKAPGTNLYYDSNSPGKYIYITGAKPYGYDEGTNGLSMDQFRSTGHLSYLRVRFVVYGWLE